MTNHVDDHDFQRFAGRFGQPVAPSPSFADSLRRRVTASSDTGTGNEQPMLTTRIPHGIAGSPPSAHGTDGPWRPAGWMGALEAAVAVLLVMSLAGASVVFRQPAALYDLAFQPTPELTQEAFNYGGDAGRTWVLGDVEPEMGGFRQEPSIDIADGQFGGPGASAILVDNSYVFTVSGVEEDELVRYELESHERAWTASMYVTGRLASDGERIFGMRADRMSTTFAATLVAIDFESGETAWEGPQLANRFIESSSLVLSGDTIFGTDYLGNVIAVDKDDGTLLWQYPETFAVPSADEDYISGPQFYPSVEIAANDEAVFLSRPSKAILSLDRETGVELGSINLVDDYGADIIASLVQVRDQQLVVTAIQAPRSEDLEAIRDYMPSSILVFDANTLVLKARTDVFDFRGNPVLAPGIVYVPTAASVEGDASLHRMDLATGDLSEPIRGVWSRWDMTLSASGNVLMVTGDPSTVAFFDIATGELLDSVELGITNMETPFGHPLRMWGENPIVITGMGEVYVIEDDSAE
ncbi:MAG: PQQ-binding-like beta-propeller repeat protein [Chloroflexia bacterium]|nr:PQQ-binding-like beta-propeller repeat protein [Chloroflexia bacterium]